MECMSILPFCKELVRELKTVTTKKEFSAYVKPEYTQFLEEVINFESLINSDKTFQDKQQDEINSLIETFKTVMTKNRLMLYNVIYNPIQDTLYNHIKNLTEIAKSAQKPAVTSKINSLMQFLPIIACISKPNESFFLTLKELSQKVDDEFSMINIINSNKRKLKGIIAEIEKQMEMYFSIYDIHIAWCKLDEALQKLPKEPIKEDPNF
ncbi:hypothetical protein TRFO_17244 [Tritrichomonas foetus]|uniref:Uncharacterized protein n=1 Tax=Tritrichomonas foetus TaxID=1144522 RepID=A0A1J4KNU6_9EUKA|nr:hypothetical protein TRFO_17244 [Tritrichomonas foetus]|eukprot:OHT12786.1 hypothetical protein TRFO_17244 [Tritrichomonas foetus]